MFSKLKNKFVFLTMSIISFILLISFTIIFFINYVSIYQEVNSRLKINYSPMAPSGGRPVNQGNMSNDLTSINLLIDSNDNIIKILSYYEYETDYYTKLYSLSNTNSNKIKYDGEIWVFSKTKLPVNNDNPNSSSIISFVNITDDVDNIQYLFFALSITYVIMLFIIYYICLYFSSKYIKPIEENFYKQKQFISDASHELKTPISIISANVDALLINSSETVKSQEKWINYIKDETKSMSKLINDLLILAKSDEVKVDLSNVSLSDILEKTVVSFDAVAYENNLKIKKNIAPNIIINSDVNKLTQLFKIFLDNSIKYASDKSTIFVSLEIVKKEVVLTFKNKTSFDNSDLSKIFDRFYKCDKARTNNSNSFGLGLPIATNIINELNYDINAHYENNYIVFTIKIK